MNTKLTKYLTLLLFIAGFVFLALTFYNVLLVKKSSLYVKTSEYFDLEYFLNNSTFSKKYYYENPYSKYTALFIITSDDCNPCKKELLNINKYLNENSVKLNINRIVLINDTNQVRSLWFAKTLRINEPKLCGSDPKYSNILFNYPDRENERQVMIIDNKNKLVIGRITLRRNFLSDTTSLKNIINDILKK